MVFNCRQRLNVSLLALGLTLSACGKDALVQDVTANVPPAAMGAPSDAMGGPGGMAPPPDESSNLVPDMTPIYKTVDGGDLKLHIFNPQNHKAGANAPAFIFYHGGGFRRGTPQAGYDLSERLNARDTVLIVPEYRLLDTSERTLDDLMSDAKSSVRYLRVNADMLGIDPDKIVASGHSAGAYLAYTVGAIDGFDSAGEDVSVSAQVNGMVLWSMGVERSEANPDIMGQGRSLDDYEPRNYIDADLPPSIFIHGADDSMLSPGPAQDFMGLVKAAGNQTGFVTVDGADHFFRTEPQRSEAIAAITRFMSANGFTSE